VHPYRLRQFTAVVAIIFISRSSNSGGFGDFLSPYCNSYVAKAIQDVFSVTYLQALSAHWIASSRVTVCSCFLLIHSFIPSNINLGKWGPQVARCLSCLLGETPIQCSGSYQAWDILKLSTSNRLFLSVAIASPKAAVRFQTNQRLSTIFYWHCTKPAAILHSWNTGEVLISH
jgi:hypothetical protein